MKLLIALAFSLSVSLLFSQKKILDHSVYDDWKSLTNTTISNDGKIAAALISPQQGDSALWIRNLSENRTFAVERVSKFTMLPNGKFTLGLQKAPFSEIRQARIKKKKAEDMPKDSLVVVNNRTFEMVTIARVKSFKTPEKAANHIAYTIPFPKDTVKKEGKKESFKPKDLIILRDLISLHEDTIRNAKEFIFNKFGNAFAVVVEPDKKDSTDVPKVLFFDLKNGIQQAISTEKREYKSLAFDESGAQLIYLSTKDTSKVEQKVFDVRYFEAGTDSATIIADKNTLGLPKKWIFNEFSSPRFSKNGERIIIGVAPQQAPKDTTIVDFEKARLDIWNWKDPLIQPQQLVELKREQNRVYTGVISPRHPDRITIIANEKMPNCTISDEGNGRFALLWSDIPYRISSQWDISPRNDVWIWDFQTNSFFEVAKSMNGRPFSSPQGNFTAWWDATQRQWFVFDNIDKKTRNITQDISVNFWDEKNDMPVNPPSYGIATWGKDDEYVLINDAFDIWKIDPKGVKKPENLTKNIGRTDSVTLRYVNTDSEKRFVESNDLLLLSAFNNKSKEKGFYTLKLRGRSQLEKIIMEKYNFSSIKKAKEADVFVFQKSNFDTSPDLYVTKNFWRSSQKLTDINPQMHEYNWGTAEKFSWKSFTGIPLQGILYKPENFDSNKKYPVLIYFYEKHSDELYQYFSPAPSRSVINIPFFVSRGYVVFTPDIHYTTGNPGQDAYNSIVAGAEALAQNRWVDKSNMGIQGQSWGGYVLS